MQLQRWELKYIIPEDTALAVARFVSSYTVLDDYGVGKPHNSYPIHSLYLDSEALTIYWHTINGNKTASNSASASTTTTPSRPSSSRSSAG